MKTYKNPISTAMSEYREDFHYNKEWWIEKMGTGRNNEYLWIQFKNGDNITVQSDYFQYDGNTCLPRFRADEVAYISRYYGDQVETTTAANIVVDTDRIILYRDGVEYFRYEMTEEEFKEMRRLMWKLDDDTDSTAWMLDYCRAFATSKMNNTVTTEPTNNTPATMNANDTTENKTMYTDYYTAVNWCNNHRVMCNNIAEIDPSVYDNARFAWYDEETEADTEIFQWFITDCSEDDVNFLESRFPGLLFTYSDLLDCFVLCVDHFGTMWKGVAIETTLEYAAEKSQLGK